MVSKESPSLENYDFDYAIEVSFKPGVTDNTASAVIDAFKISSNATNTMPNITCHSGKVYLIKLAHSKVTKEHLNDFAKELLGNFLLNNFTIYTRQEFETQRFDNPIFNEVQLTQKPVQSIDLDQDINKLMQLNQQNCWALSKKELEQIISHYNLPEVKAQRAHQNMSEMPTDVEMEVIAQSWSEHCKHKIFWRY